MKTTHIDILCWERYGHLYMSQPVIQAKCHRGTEEGEPAGIYERVLEKIIKQTLKYFNRCRSETKLVKELASWKLERVLHVHRGQCLSQRTGAEHVGVGEEKSRNEASVKTAWRSSIAHKKVYSFGVKETMVEVLGLNSQNIMKGRSYNSVSLKCMSAI